MTQIHPTALVHPGANIHSTVSIGPYCTVGPHVVLGAHCQLISHVVLDGHTTLGQGTKVFPFASVGMVPQDLKYQGEPTQLIVGENNTIREYVTLQPGTVQDQGKTTIGNGNLFMAYVHVAHDCILGDHNILANGVQLSGHVHMGSHVVVGGMAGIHQHCRLGDGAMVGAGSVVTGDVPPYCLAEGNRAVLRGLNTVGLKRRGFSSADLQAIKDLYKFLFLKQYPTLEEAILAWESHGAVVQGRINTPTQRKLTEYESTFLQFIRQSHRRVLRP